MSRQEVNQTTGRNQLRQGMELSDKAMKWSPRSAPSLFCLSNALQPLRTPVGHVAIPGPPGHIFPAAPGFFLLRILPYLLLNLVCRVRCNNALLLVVVLLCVYHLQPMTRSSQYTCQWWKSWQYVSAWTWTLISALIGIILSVSLALSRCIRAAGECMAQEVSAPRNIVCLWCVPTLTFSPFHTQRPHTPQHNHTHA